MDERIAVLNEVIEGLRRMLAKCDRSGFAMVRRYMSIWRCISPCGSASRHSWKRHEWAAGQ